MEDQQELEEYIVHESDHDSVSEQNADKTSEKDDSPLISDKYFMSKKHDIKWKMEGPVPNVRTHAQDIIKLLHGPKNGAKYAKTEIECINLMIFNEIVRTITACTNIYVSQIRENYQRKQDIRDTDKF
ncbi:hypothetical protein HHI36_011508 [Cryptolaemus montrouzieri]|uniref:Uncharacterized protein n=1 Tax=Cryptolaemus montrouzieri TaxID=559131 RepID=A0ABD2MM02_9CUCU